MRASFAGLLVYADHMAPVTGAAAWQQVRLACEDAVSAHRHDAIAAALMMAGAFEAAVADAMCAKADGRRPPLVALRAVTDALGDALATSWCGRDASPHTGHASLLANQVNPVHLPRSLVVKKPEGYAFYALYPEAYVEAAWDWCVEAAPRSVFCLGLRGIGTSLASAVAGALRLRGIPTTTWTVRPHGHPFDRDITLDDQLVATLDRARSTFLVVDEGPGLSGSSLTGAARALRELGVADDRIHLFAAWDPDPSQLRSEAARRTWRRHRVITAGFERVRARVLDEAGVPPQAIDVSGGRWRQYFLNGDPWPAAHPQHERVKLLVPGASLTRFAGLGEWGATIKARGDRIAAAGWTPHTGTLTRGFLTSSICGGHRVTRRSIDDSFLRAAAAYVGWLKREETTGGLAVTDRLGEMLFTNACEALGADAAGPASALAEDARWFAEPAVRIDGRMLLHEWIQGASGFVKTDALDHHGDHFLPGATDPAWDVAGLIVEAPLRDGSRARFVDAYVRASADTTIGRRLRFYVAAYAAFRVGYSALAETAGDPEEQKRFRIDRARYTTALARALSAIPNAPSIPRPAGAPPQSRP